MINGEYSWGACRHAERKLGTSTLIPDVDNANVGKYNHIIL